MFYSVHVGLDLLSFPFHLVHLEFFFIFYIFGESERRQLQVASYFLSLPSCHIISGKTSLKRVREREREMPPLELKVKLPPEKTHQTSLSLSLLITAFFDGFSASLITSIMIIIIIIIVAAIIK